jgi:hypothetical protein
MNPKLKLLVVVISVAIIIFLASVFFKSGSNNLQWFTQKEVLAPPIYSNFSDNDLKLIGEFEADIQFNSESLFKKQGLLVWQDLVASDKSNKTYELNNLSQEYKDYIVARWNKIKIETESDHTKVELYLEKEYEAMGTIKSPN